VFKLELDMSLYYVPPMDEHGAGIVITRTLELPFAPSTGMFLCGTPFSDQPDSMGFKLENVTWDIDRQMFLASTCLFDHGLPIAFIPDVIREWTNRGWRLGSYEDAYEQPEESEPEEVEDQGSEEVDDEWEEMEHWPSKRPSLRPPEFNKLLRAIVRAMVESRNNLAVAYAIDKTKRFFDESQLKEGDSPAIKKWIAAQREFGTMPWDDQIAWRDRVMKRHPRMDRIVADL